MTFLNQGLSFGNRPSTANFQPTTLFEHPEGTWLPPGGMKGVENKIKKKERNAEEIFLRVKWVIRGCIYFRCIYFRPISWDLEELGIWAEISRCGCVFLDGIGVPQAAPLNQTQRHLAIGISRKRPDRPSGTRSCVEGLATGGEVVVHDNDRQTVREHDRQIVFDPEWFQLIELQPFQWLQATQGSQNKNISSTTSARGRNTADCLAWQLVHYCRI